MAPRSTYRVQVRPEFDLSATAGLTGYLAALGVSHLYSAPLLAATPRSEHGYDVVDHSRVNPELGGARALADLAGRLREAGLRPGGDRGAHPAGVGRAEDQPG